MNNKFAGLLLLFFIIACNNNEIVIPTEQNDSVIFQVSADVTSDFGETKKVNLSVSNTGYFNTLGIDSLNSVKSYSSKLQCNTDCGPSIKFTLVDELISSKVTGKSTFRRGLYRFADKEEDLDIYQVKFINRSTSLAEGTSVLWTFEEDKQTALGIDTVVLNLKQFPNLDFHFTPTLSLTDSEGYVSSISPKIDLINSAISINSEIAINSITNGNVELELNIPNETDFYTYWFKNTENLIIADVYSANLGDAISATADEIQGSEDNYINFFREIKLNLSNNEFDNIPKFDATIDVIPNGSKFQLSRFNIEYSQNGKVYNNSNNIIEDESIIKVTHIEKYKHQFNGMPTLVVDIEYACTLSTENGESIKLENGKAKLAFNYIE